MLKIMNIIFLGGFEYPHGMAGTKRIQHAISGLTYYPDISIHVVVLSQSNRKNTLNGIHNGIPYETVMADLVGIKKLVMIPVLHINARRIIKRLYQKDKYNILYVYGPPSLDNLTTVRFARDLGFKIVFDIVEDYELARDISRSVLHHLKVSYIYRKIKNIASIADGIVVISSHLENKFREITSGVVPLYYMPITVDMNCYPVGPKRFGNPICLFYAGSFGKKDGVPYLLEAFDQLAARHNNIILVLTGMGSDEAMRSVNERISASPYQDRIIYKGYLDDASYYAALNFADILCMPRIDIGYAQAGFPFKLGEYLATGKPVIASAVSDIPDILKDRQDVILVKPGEGDAIVDATEFIINDPELAFAIGARGRAIAQRLFDYRVQSKELRDFLLKITDQDRLHENIK